MDTTTILAIIEMIDARNSSDNESYTNLLYSMYEPYEPETKSYFRGKCEALDELRNHLQSYIESQVSALENSTGE